MTKPIAPQTYNQVSYRDRLKLLTGAAGLAALSACGGGSGASTPTPPPSGGTPVAPTPPAPAAPAAPVEGLLRDSYRNNFVVGAAVSTSQVATGSEDADILAKQFGSITAENVMKPEALAPTEGNYTFEDADNLVAFAEANNLQVRGHTLLWHRATPDYFFEGTREEVKARLQKYVTDVVTHFKGKIYAWDVVNEVVSDDDGPTAPYRDSNWYQAAGGADYIDWAFEAARAADPDVQLFINDYSTELAGKRGRLVSVVEDLIARGIPLDGVGHQAHIQQSTAAADVLAALDTFTDMFAGLENHITELDISVYNDPGSCFENGVGCQASIGNTFSDARARDQATRYRELFTGFAARSNLTSVTLWGITDDESWLNNYPVNRPNYPLLYDADRNPKPAFFAITDPNYVI